MLSVTFSTVMLIVIMQSVSFFYCHSECLYAEYRGAFQPSLLGNVSNYTRKVIYRYSPCEGSLKNLEDAKKNFFPLRKKSICSQDISQKFKLHSKDNWDIGQRTSL
jgi:hypothetical protein